MTRIIAGATRGATLAIPRSGTRPTSERVREAMFSAIEARMELAGARVLDLYAGSGALGLEAVSRGAAGVTLVERDARAVRVLRGNARTVRERIARGLQPDASGPDVELAPVSVERFLREREASFGLVFLDPPYGLEARALEAALALLPPRLSTDAAVLIERSARDEEPRWPDGLQCVRRRSYGETAIYDLRPA